MIDKRCGKRKVKGKINEKKYMVLNLTDSRNCWRLWDTREREGGGERGGGGGGGGGGREKKACCTF